jgi:uncharacterized membrane protein YeaQ/YmgE (transglycosylase-associated protein family)
MDIQRLLITALIGIASGFLGSLVVGGVKGGLIGLLIAGLVGGLVGGWLLNTLGVKLTGNGLVDSILQGAIGAILVIILARMFL